MSELADGHVYSYSQLSSFNKCKFGFYLQRIEKVPTVSNGFSEQGTLIHDILEKWAKGELARDELEAEYIRRYPEEVVTAFPRMLAARGYTEKTYDQGLMYFRFFDEFEGYKVVSAEEKFIIDLPIKDGSTRPFVGIVDLVLRDKSTGGLVVCDHKSKSLNSFKKDQDKMYRQQYLYSAYIKEKYKEDPETLMFNLFKEGGELMTRPFDQKVYEECLAWASDQILGIEDCDVLSWLETKPKQDFFCTELCSVRNECPQGHARR